MDIMKKVREFKGSDSDSSKGEVEKAYDEFTRANQDIGRIFGPSPASAILGASVSGLFRGARTGGKTATQERARRQQMQRILQQQSQTNPFKPNYGNPPPDYDRIWKDRAASCSEPSVLSKDGVERFREAFNLFSSNRQLTDREHELVLKLFFSVHMELQHGSGSDITKSAVDDLENFKSQQQEEYEW